MTHLPIPFKLATHDGKFIYHVVHFVICCQGYVYGNVRLRCSEVWVRVWCSMVCVSIELWLVFTADNKKTDILSIMNFYGK